MESKLISRYFTVSGRKWLIFILSFWALSYFINIWPVVFLVGLCALNATLLIYDRYVDLPIDIELSTFSAIIMALKFGLVWGIAAGLLTKMTAIISNRDFNKNSLISLASYALAAVLANLFRGLPLVYLGLIVTVLVNVFSFAVMKFVLLASEYEIISYSISNIMFNVVVFVGFADLIFRLLPFAL
ncbi:MAG: hypothetical protein ABIJ34_09630 [archaeon]